MFTGLIEAVCKVVSANGSRVTIDLGELAGQTDIGSSIAVNGTCLTVIGLDRNSATFDISPETLEKSTLADLTPSSTVNIERAMKAYGRFAGHFVQGHIDGVAAIKQISKKGQFTNMKFQPNPEILEQIIVKGSVSIDGVSLTVASMDENSFEVALIPETLKKTTLGNANIGDMVNIETDIIVKTIKKQLENILPKKQGLTLEKLRESGF